MVEMASPITSPMSWRNIGGGPSEASQMSQSSEVTVVGGGLGGLAAALSLRERACAPRSWNRPPSWERWARVFSRPQRQPRPGRPRAESRPREHPHRTAGSGRRWPDGSGVALTPSATSASEDHNAPYWHYHRADLHKVIMDACVDPDGPGPVVDMRTRKQVVAVDRTDPAGPSRPLRTASGPRPTS